MEPQLAFLGMGNIGKAISKNLVTKGKLRKSLLLWNRTHVRAVTHATEIGLSKAVERLEDIVYQSDIIWTCLADQEAVLDTFDTILTMEVQGKLFLECSTITPTATDHLATKIRQAGAEFVAMPVFGEPGLASRGLLICVPAGTSESVARIKPYLEGVIGRAVVDFSGEEPGKASLLKNVGNVLILNAMESIAECHVLAEKTGLGVQNLQMLVEAIYPTGPYMIYSKGMSSGRYFKEQPVVQIKIAQNVASHVLALAEESQTSLKAYETAVRHLALAESHVGKAGDILGIYGAVRLESDLPYENCSTEDSCKQDDSKRNGR